MSKQALWAENIDVKYPGSKSLAVNNVSLQIDDGEIVALLGESGCGKSSLLRVLSGFVQPVQGQVSIYDREVINIRKKIWVNPEKRNLGMVFQDHALFPHMTVEQNILFGIHKEEKAYKKERLEHLIDLCHLAGLSKRFPHELSGGQKQRVALARSLAPKPFMLLLDEPFNNLDIRLKSKIIPEIQEMIKKAGIPAIFVTHDRWEAYELADRILIMEAGRIVQQGTASEVYQNPKDSYIAEFLGPINILHSHDQETIAIRPEQIHEAPLFGPEKEDPSQIYIDVEIDTIRFSGNVWEIKAQLQANGEFSTDSSIIIHRRTKPHWNYGELVSFYATKSVLNEKTTDTEINSM